MSGTLGYLVKSDDKDKVAVVETAAVADAPMIIVDGQEKEGENPFVVDAKLTAKQKKERDDRTIFVANIAFEATGEQVAEEFQQYGKIERIWIRPAKSTSIIAATSSSTRKNAYILFASADEAKASLQGNGKLFLETHLRIDKANERILDYSRTAFVGNLSFKTTEDQLRVFFSECGDILNVRLIRDPVSNESKGFGYIFFKEKSGVRSAIAKNGEALLKREIRVKNAVSPDVLENPQAELAAKKQALIAKKKLAAAAAAAKGEGETDEIEGEKPMKKLKKSAEPLDIVPLKDFKNIVKVNFTENENDIFVFQNEMSIAPRILRKKIKKLSKKGVSQTSAFKQVQQLKKTKKANNDKTIFGSKHTLAARREKRLKRSEENRSKGKLETKKEERKVKKVKVPNRGGERKPKMPKQPKLPKPIAV